MGTRNLTLIKKNGNYVLAKYCQWDGYYEGQGMVIADYLRVPGRIKRLRERADDLCFLTPGEIKARWVEVGAKPDETWVSMNVAGQFHRRYPELSRNTGGDILKMICESEGPFATQNDLDFAADGLFCEFAYVIDFDENTFSWYRGFSQSRLPETERFAFLNDVAEANGTDGYYPVRQIGKVPLAPQYMPTADQWEDFDK